MVSEMPSFLEGCAFNLFHFICFHSLSFPGSGSPIGLGRSRSELIDFYFDFNPVRVRAVSATVPFRGRAVHWSNHRWSIVSNWQVAFVLVLAQKGT